MCPNPLSFLVEELRAFSGFPVGPYYRLAFAAFEDEACHGLVGVVVDVNVVDFSLVMWAAKFANALHAFSPSWRLGQPHNYWKTAFLPVWLSRPLMSAALVFSSV